MAARVHRQEGAGVPDPGELAGRPCADVDGPVGEVCVGGGHVGRGDVGDVPRSAESECLLLIYPVVRKIPSNPIKKDKR